MPYYPVSPQFEAALLASHQVVSQVDAYYGGALVRSAIPIVDGTVTVDRGSAVRRSLSLTVADPGLLPWSATDPLAVFGQQLVVRCGIVLGAITEWVPAGTFTIDQPSGDADGLDQFTLSGSSSELLLQDSPFTAAATTRGYSDCVAAITGLIRAILPAAVVVNLTADGRTPAVPTTTWDAGSDRWQAITQVAAAMSAEVGCDALDRFVITDIPDPSTATSWDWDVSYGGVLLTDSRQMQRSGVYNGVLATGGNASDNAPPVSYLATDNRSTSPTRWGGPFGHKVKTISSDLYTTTGACQAAAVAALRDAIAPSITTTLTAVPNPALDAGVIVRTVHGNGVVELCAIQSVTIPLAETGDCTLTMRGAHTDDAGG